MNLQDIKNQNPCAGRWDHFLAGLEHHHDDFPATQEITLGDVAVVNGAADAMWCMRALDWNNIAVRRKFVGAVLLPTCERMAVHTTDSCVRFTIDILHRWCDGDDDADLLAAGDAAWAASRSSGFSTTSTVAAAAAAAVWAAWAAAGTVAGTAVWACAAEREQQRRDIIAAYPPLVVENSKRRTEK